MQTDTALWVDSKGMEYVIWCPRQGDGYYMLYSYLVWQTTQRYIRIRMNHGEWQRYWSLSSVVWHKWISLQQHTQKGSLHCNSLTQTAFVQLFNRHTGNSLQRWRQLQDEEWRALYIDNILFYDSLGGTPLQNCSFFFSMEFLYKGYQVHVIGSQVGTTSPTPWQMTGHLHFPTALWHSFAKIFMTLQQDLAAHPL